MSIFYARLVCRINFGNPSALVIAKKNTLKFSSLVLDCMKLSRYHRLCTSSVVHNNEKLLGVSYLKDGNGAVSQLDEEYPDWLWQLNKHKQTMEEFDPHSRTYRKLLRKRQRREENERRKMKRF